MRLKTTAKCVHLDRLHTKPHVEWILLVDLDAELFARVLLVGVAKNGVSAHDFAFHRSLLVRADDIDVETEAVGVQLAIRIAAALRVPVRQQRSLPAAARLRHIEPDGDLGVNATIRPCRLRVKIHDSRGLDVGETVEGVSGARGDEEGEHAQRMGFHHRLFWLRVRGLRPESCPASYSLHTQVQDGQRIPVHA